MGDEEHFGTVRTVLDPVRYILLAHPTLARVVGQIIGKDNLWMQVLNTGASTSPADLIGGLMTRAVELSGDRFGAAVHELNTFLTPAREAQTFLELLAVAHAARVLLLAELRHCIDRSAGRP